MTKKLDISETRTCEHGKRYDDDCPLCKVDEIVQDAIEEIAAKLSAIGTGLEPVPQELHDVPYVAMQKIADWIKAND